MHGMVRYRTELMLDGLLQGWSCKLLHQDDDTQGKRESKKNSRSIIPAWTNFVSHNGQVCISTLDKFDFVDFSIVNLSSYVQL